MKKGYLLLLVVILIVIGGVVSIYHMQKKSADSLFVYGDFLKGKPGFADTEAKLLQEQKYAELGAYFESYIPQSDQDSKDRFYLQYIAMRAYVNAVRINPQDSASLDKALQLGQELLSDQHAINTAPNFVAFSVDAIDRMAYPLIPAAVHEKFLNHPFFAQKFADPQDPKDIDAFRRNLLGFGNSLFRVTNIKMKLALLSLDSLRKSKDSPVRFKLQKEQVLLSIREAENSLAFDRQENAYPFGQRGYLSETLLTRALLAAKYEFLTQELPLGPVDKLYEEALQEAKEHSPNNTQLIQHYLEDQKKNYSKN